MRKYAVLGLLLVMTFVFASGMAAAPKPEEKAAKVEQESTALEPIVVDTAGEWWKFDNIQMKVEENGTVSMSGKTSKWYVGGIGTYLGKDLTGYTHLTTDIFGTGPASGNLKIELYDDDNGNYDIEQDPKTYAPLKDERWIFEQKINWKGWKHIAIPFTAFKLDNPGVGNGIFDPNQENSSGGLIQMQLIVTISPKKVGSANLKINNIKFEKL